MSSEGRPNPEEFYSEEFYRTRESGAQISAETILPIIFDAIEVRSVVDIGCGTGTWLAVAHRLGAEQMLGIDGDWVRKELLTDNDIDLVSHDLEKPITIKNTYDLAISLEVGEHLSSDRASSFISDICKTSNRVLFSAAIPGQEGNNPTHINEQWQSYWCSLFKMNGYYPLDIVRPTVWKNKRIPIHYRQNTLFYVQGDEYEKLRKTVMPKDTGNEFTSLDVVHPELYFNKISRLGRELGVRESVGIALRIPLALLRSIRHRIIR